MAIWRCAMARILCGAALVLAGPALAETVSLKSGKASVIPATDLAPVVMTYHEGRAAVRGSFRVDAVQIGDALNARVDKPVMIFVLDKTRAAQGCTLHKDITFVALIDVPPVDGKQVVQFGLADEIGQGVMPLGAYHDMERRGCIAIKSRPVDSIEPDATEIPVRKKKKIVKDNKQADGTVPRPNLDAAPDLSAPTPDQPPSDVMVLPDTQQ